MTTLSPITQFFQIVGSTLGNTTQYLIESYQNNPTFQSYVNGNILFFAIFLVYLETKVQGIFFRRDDTNQIRFRPLGFTGFLTYPLRSIDPWRPENWDLNFIIFIQLGALFYTFLKSFENNIA